MTDHDDLREWIRLAREASDNAAPPPWVAEARAVPDPGRELNPDEHIVRMAGGQDSTILRGPDARFIAVARRLLPELAEACAEILDEREKFAHSDVAQLTEALQKAVEGRDAVSLESARLGAVAGAARRFLDARDLLEGALAALDVESSNG
jgi:hypothetical protein